MVRISNPVRLDPWHNIVDCHFGQEEPPYTGLWLTCFGQVYSTAAGIGGYGDKQYVGDTSGFPSLPGIYPDYINHWIAGHTWYETEYGGDEPMWSQMQVYNASGTLIDQGSLASLGATVGKPTLPYTIGFGAWEYWTSGGFPATSDGGPIDDVDGTILVPNPVGTFFADAGIFYGFALGYESGPTYYAVGAYKEEYAKTNRSLYHPIGPVSLRCTTATYAGKTFVPVGYQTIKGGYYASTDMGCVTLFKEENP